MFIIVYTNVWLDGGKKKKKRGLTYLRNIRVKLSIESVSFLLDLRQPRLRVLQSFLMLAHRLHHLITLVQHLHHQLLKVSLFVGELRAPLAHAVLRDRRHHVAHHIPHFASCTSSQRARYSRQDYSIFFFSLVIPAPASDLRNHHRWRTHRAHTHTHAHTHTARARAVQRYARCRVTCTRKNDTPHTRANQTHAHTYTHTHTQIDKVRKRKSVGIPLVRALLWTRTDISLFPIALSPPLSLALVFASRRILALRPINYSIALLAFSPRVRLFLTTPMTSARSRCICFTDDGGSRTFSSLTACVSRLDYTCYIKSCDSQSRRKKKREGQARAISQIQRLSFILSVPFFFPSFLS